MLKIGLSGSQLMRKYFKRVSNTGPNGYTEVRFSSERNNTHGRIDLLFNIMQSPELDAIYGIHPMAEEIQHVLDTDKEGSSLLSSWVLGQLSDVALLSELMHQLFTFYLWSIV